MASTAHSSNLPTFESPHERDEVGRQLQAMLVDLIDLSLVGKQLHWSVTGANFRSLHLQLDEFVDSWRALSDTVAERAVAVGFWPDGQSATVAGAAELSTLERGELEDRVVIRELTHRVAQVAERARERMDRLDELDAASQDVLVEVVRALEEQLWMIRVQTPASH